MGTLTREMPLSIIRLEKQSGYGRNFWKGLEQDVPDFFSFTHHTDIEVCVLKEESVFRRDLRST